MKKQIIFLAIVLLTISLGSAFGQATHTSAPKDLVTCTNDALHPFAGKPYDYSVTTTPSTGTYTWWATTVPSFITAGVLQNTVANVKVSPDVVATTPADYNSATSTASTIQLTWGTAVLAAAMAPTSTPTFVAVYYTGTTCADNLKVYQVEPINAFTVDITNVKNDTKASLAYGAEETQCYAKVQSAIWSPATGKMVYDYGVNTLYFEVVAANFTGTWTPTFTLTGLDATQSATIVWDYSTSFTAPVTVTTGVASTTAVTTSETNTSNGVSIFVKVTISNQTFEGLTDKVISLGVTGTNSAGQRDVLATDCATSATLASNTTTQTLNLRPTVTNNTVVGTFEQP
jgi:hypothetical protein